MACRRWRDRISDTLFSMKMRVTARGLAGLTRVLRATRHGKRSSGSNRWCVHAWVRVCARTRFLPVRFPPEGLVGQTSRNRLPGEIRRPLSVITMAALPRRDDVVVPLYFRGRVAASHTWLAKINGETATFVTRTRERKLHNARRGIHERKLLCDSRE